MIMNIKQWKIQIEPKTKLNYNIYNPFIKLNLVAEDYRLPLSGFCKH